MNQEITQCLELGTSLSEKVLTETLLKYVKICDEQQKIDTEIENSMKGRHMIPDFPLQDTFWYFKEIRLKHQDLSQLRMLVLSDAGLSQSTTIQFSLMQAGHVSYENQAMKLLFQGCFYPLDGRKPRRPRFLYLSDLLKDSNIHQETDKLGIHVCGSMPSGGDLETLKHNLQSIPCCRQCSVCGISGFPDMFFDCDKCGAVLYCRARCQTEDWEESHQEWCLLFKRFMTLEAKLADLPFNFASETTKRDFDGKNHKKFIQMSGMHEQGLRQFECSPSSQDFPTVCTVKQKKGDTHSAWFSAHGLEKESSLLELPLQQRDKPVDGWWSYYKLRGFSMDSIIAIVLHFSLTVYYIVNQLLPKDFHEVFNEIQQSQKICIHLIGAEKEVEMFYPFLECARLLAPMTVDIHLFGNNFDDFYACQTTAKENLHFQIHKEIYHKANHEHIPAPHIAVCLNGGIGAYTSYIKTVKYLTRNKTPFYYTDYGQASIAFSSKTMIDHKAGRVSSPRINPFRCPLRVAASDQNLPRYSNAFICYVTSYP